MRDPPPSDRDPVRAQPSDERHDPDRRGLRLDEAPLRAREHARRPRRRPPGHRGRRLLEPALRRPGNKRRVRPARPVSLLIHPFRSTRRDTHAATRSACTPCTVPRSRSSDEAPAMVAVKRACSLCRSKVPRADCQRCGSIQLSLFEDPPPPVPDDAETITLGELAEAGRRAKAEHRARIERLSRLGRAVRVGLDGCAKSKRDQATKCRELYTSPLFVASLAHAERVSDEVYIISAVHGLLGPDEIISPYDRSLREMSKKERLAWGERLVSSIRARFERLPLELLVLAGLEYAAPIRVAALRYSWTFEAPLAKKSIGQRLVWLKSQVPPP